MKKICLLFLMVVGICGSFGSNVEAARLKEVTPEMNEDVTKLFEELDESDSIVKLPDGGYLHGGAHDVSADDPNKILATYDSETDPNAITVGEAIDLIETETENPPFERIGIAPRVSTPPPTSAYRVLHDGGKYLSQIFTGSGWQFSGMGFMPAKGTGIYLGWQAFGDDGNVGGINAASSTWSGFYSGSPLYVSAGYSYKMTSEYHPGAPNCMIFYSYNPVRGSRYMVANI